MSRAVQVYMEPADLAKIEAVLQPRAYRAAIKRGVNKTTRAATTTLSKTIRNSYFVKASAVKQASRTTLASTTSLSAEIALFKPRHKGVPLSNFAPNRRKVGKGVGVSVKIRRDKPREVVDKRSKYSLTKKGAFMTNSRRVLERRGRGRYPLVTPVGPTVIEMARETAAIRAAAQDADTKLPINVQREVAFELKRRAR